MPISDDFRDFALEELGRCAPALRFKRMFGGGGVYSRDRIFALLDDDTVYLKGDATTKDRYLAAGMAAFCPDGDPAHVMSYYAVPGDVLEDHDQLAPWVALALEVADRAKAPKRRKADAAEAPRPKRPPRR